MISTRVRCQSLENVREYQRFDLLAPEEIKVLEMWHLLCNSMTREFFQHHLDVDETVATAINQNNWRFDVSCRKFGNFIVSIVGHETQWSLYIVIVHLKAFVTDDLKPMYYTFRTSERIEMRIRSQLLRSGDVFPRPIE